MFDRRIPNHGKWVQSNCIRNRFTCYGNFTLRKESKTEEQYEIQSNVKNEYIALTVQHLTYLRAEYQVTAGVITKWEGSWNVTMKYVWSVMLTIICEKLWIPNWLTSVEIKPLQWPWLVSHVDENLIVCSKISAF